MGHVGGLIVGGIVVIVIALSLSRSIKRASRMNADRRDEGR